MGKFVHLHLHTEQSLYDGMGKVSEFVERAVELKQKALAITNHGVLSGNVEHYLACKEAGIKPILGVEAYFMPKFKKVRKRFHIIILAKNKVGWDNLKEMCSYAYREQFYYYPIIDRDLLYRFREGLIVLGGCVSGYVPRMLNNGEEAKAIRAHKWFMSTFGDDYYLEFQPYDFPEQHKTNKLQLKVLKKYGGNGVLTGDCHYPLKEDEDTHTLTFLLKHSTKIADYSNRHLLSKKEIRQMVEDNPTPLDQFINVSGEIADKIEDYELEKTPVSFPKIPTTRKEFRELIYKRMKKAIDDPVYKKRVDFEIKVIADNKFISYFMLCYDICRFARKNNIMIGAGRGSVCGSLVAFYLGITRVDPIVRKTLFERFLRDDKKELPDIDIDVESDGRDRVINYIMGKYEGQAIPLSNFVYWKGLSLMNALVREMKYGERERRVLSESGFEDYLRDGISFDDMPDFIKEELKSEIPLFYKYYSRLEGGLFTIGKHAGGVVIAGDNIERSISVIRSKTGIQSACDKNSIIGGVKLDILGLKTLSVMRSIIEETGANLSEIQVQDERRMFEKFQAGNTTAIFQFESRPARSLLKRVKPNSIHDLSVVSALNRPQPIQSKIPDRYIVKKRGNDMGEVFLDELKDTYGEIVFQEQIMGFCQRIGFSLDECDKIIKASKNAEARRKGEEYREEFVNRAVNQLHLREKQANIMFSRMIEYSFNRAHAVGYSIIAYWQMYLKVNYPLEFWCQTINYAKDKKERSKYELSALKESKAIIAPATINSGYGYKVRVISGEKIIQRGLISVEGLGAKTAELIESNGRYKSKEDFVNKKLRGIGVKTIETLDKSGLFVFKSSEYLERVNKTVKEVMESAYYRRKN